LASHMTSVAVLGYGRAGKIHAANVSNKEGLSLKYVYDTQQLSPELPSGATFTTDLQQVLSDQEVLAVFVCTPTSTHHELVKLALEHKKHVFCEKPLADTVDEIDECFNLAEENGRVLLCGYNRRFDPSLVKLKDEIASVGRIYQVLTIARDYPYPPRSYLEVSGGIFHDCAVHDIDLINWVLDSRPVSVSVLGNVLIDPAVGAGELDNTCLLLEYPGGVIGTVNLSRIANSYDQRVSVFGLQGVAEITNSESQQPMSFADRYQLSYVAELDHFWNAIHSKEPLRMPRRACTDLVHIVEACEQAHNSKQKASISYGDIKSDIKKVSSEVSSGQLYESKLIAG